MHERAPAGRGSDTAETLGARNPATARPPPVRRNSRRLKGQLEQSSAVQDFGTPFNRVGLCTIMLSSHETRSTPCAKITAASAAVKKKRPTQVPACPRALR